MSKSIVFAGFMIGVLFGGVLSDKFGRKPIVYFPSVLCSLFALIASFAEVFWLFNIVLRALVGVCLGSSSIAIFVLMVEYVGVRHRAMAGTSLWYFFTIALMPLFLLAYFIRNWRYLSIAASAPALLQVFLWWFIPESSRWLITNAKHEISKEIFAKIARTNRKELPPNPISLVEEKQRVGDVRDLFRSWKMTRLTLISWFNWLAVSVVYWGALFSFDAFGGNIYLAFFLTAIVEIPSIYLTIKAMNRFGRRKSALGSLIMASIASTVAVLLMTRVSDEGFRIGTVIMSMVAKFFITFAFDTIYVYTCELFPTVVRNVAMGTSSGSARLGSIAAPFVVELIRVHIIIPWIIFAIFAAIACVLVFTLPETNNAPTKETFVDEEKQLKRKANGIDNPGIVDNTEL
ncbi:Solute carrier family 22 member 5 [Exaiptasia diaphana]|nr:Solute carrier family 22 member 5 [Exaiptasia diaphana]